MRKQVDHCRDDSANMDDREKDRMKNAKVYELDQNYSKKFGLFKRASLLSYYGRDNESW